MVAAQVQRLSVESVASVIDDDLDCIVAMYRDQCVLWRLQILDFMSVQQSQRCVRSAMIELSMTEGSLMHSK